ncbi:hypothetical protein V0288_08675 [Pannus brasiliensis CCIBt3594]|uniref:PEP-CTERM sorting domain-containing protein n=1 Tax=Pannus brasiliensis CCIBt3594 TaxID=1427578 RepID=A0AAW9QTT5_9CHRO
MFLRFTSPALALSLCFSLTAPSLAINLVTSRAALSGNDSLNWSSVGTFFPPSTLPLSFTATSAGGLGVTVSIPTPPTLPSPPQITNPLIFQTTASGIETNFAEGDFILFTGLKPGTPPPTLGNPGPLSIAFDSPVKGAGAQIAADDATTSYTAYIEAFDVNGNSLGIFDIFPATSSLALDNSAVFIGVSSPSAEISRIAFSSDVALRAIGINTLSINNPAIPEPSGAIALILFGSGLIAVKRKR